MKPLFLQAFPLGIVLATAQMQSAAQSIRVGPVLQDASPTDIWIMWETTSGTQSLVEYGLTASLGSIANGSSIHSIQGAQIHHTQLDDLDPDTVYHYRVTTNGVMSQILTFRTPARSSSEQSFRFVALSDTQGGPISDMHTRTINDGIIRFVEREFGPNLHDEVDFVIQPGDLVSTGSDYNQWKTQYFDEAQNLYQHVPVYPVPGNHEQDTHWFFDYFKLPDNGTPGFEEHWWYKDHGNIRLIGCDSNGGYRNQEQLDWLDDVLADAATNDDIDFVFAQMHHPHLSGIWTPGNTPYTGLIVEKLGQFSSETNKPSIHFFGHTHAYERGQSKDHNHMYVNVAAGEGGIDYWDQSDVDYDEFQRVFPEWGFVVMEVEAGDDPQFRLRRVNRGNDFITRDNEVMDDITVKRYNNGPHTPAPMSPVPGTIGIDPDSVMLIASGFSDPEGNTHLESEFQLTTVEGDYSDPARSEWIRFENWYAPENASGGSTGYYSVNTVEDPNITRIQLDLLDGDTPYFWRVRYRDSGLEWSEWSQESSFVTAPAPDGACCTLTQACEQMREQACIDIGGEWLGLDTSCEECPDVFVAFSENFDQIDLGPAVDESGSDDVWSDQPPAGWMIDRTGMPNGGITEWRGWGMADPEWWVQVAGDQGRSGFTKASNVTAIADPDEWDDAAHDEGTFNSWLESPVIDVSMIEPGTAKLAFVSSWRPEDNQRAMIIVRVDGEQELVIADWQSTSGDQFKPDAVNETVVIDLNLPDDASDIELSFGLLDAGNDWWWAIDNIMVVGQEREQMMTLLDENFESILLESTIDEAPTDDVWTDVPPMDWSIDNSGVPSIGIADEGVTEWEGWAFADKDWWVSIADDQRRSEFSFGEGTVAIADPDEWDDLGDPESLGLYHTILQTPEIDVSSARVDSMVISFDSSWRPEDLQRAMIHVSFDHGTPVTLLDWRSEAGEFFHPDSTNERVILQVENPGGAHSMSLTFSMRDAANDWWWAIDNLKVTADCVADFADPERVLNFFDVSAFINSFIERESIADLNTDNAFNYFDIQIFLQAYARGCK